MSPRLSLLVLLAAALAGCGADATAPADAAVTLTLGDTLLARDPTARSARVRFRIENQGVATAYVPRCGEAIGADVERWVGGRWVAYSSAICIAVLDMSPMPLGPGEARTGMHLLGEAGRFRMLVRVTSSAAGEEVTRVVSAPFVVL